MPRAKKEAATATKTEAKATNGKRNAGKEKAETNQEEKPVPEKKPKEKPLKGERKDVPKKEISAKNGKADEPLEPPKRNPARAAAAKKKDKVEEKMEVESHVTEKAIESEDKKEPVQKSGEAVKKQPQRGARGKKIVNEETADPTTSTTVGGKRAKEKTEKAKSEEPAPKKTAAKRGKAPKKTEELNEESDNEIEEEEVESKQSRKRKAPAKSDAPKNKTTKVNTSSTDWSTLDFKCSTKNAKGKTSNFHITSWNVDGLRAWLKKGGLEIVEHDKPDIFCLQETKCDMEQLPDEVKNMEGYETLWVSSDKAGYAGVGIATKVKPLSVTYGIDSEEHDSEGRCITAEFEKFYLVNVYVPNAGRKLVTLPKRLEWNKLFKDYIMKLDEKKPVIICGDMNVAHNEIDLANPKTNTKNAGFTPEEREGMTEFLNTGFVDSFRELYPDKEAYTFWTYMAGARAKNVGWRLDYFLVSKRFMENVCDSVIHSKAFGSDHCPLTLHFHI